MNADGRRWTQIFWYLYSAPITTAYLRRGSYSGLSARDWRIFLCSVLLSNAVWALACFGGVEALRRLCKRAAASSLNFQQCPLNPAVENVRVALLPGRDCTALSEAETYCKRNTPHRCDRALNTGFLIARWKVL
jgi:hypothetical protein